MAAQRGMNPANMPRLIPALANLLPEICSTLQDLANQKKATAAWSTRNSDEDCIEDQRTLFEGQRR